MLHEHHGIERCSTVRYALTKVLDAPNPDNSDVLLNNADSARDDTKTVPNVALPQIVEMGILTD